jgi:hypothetical protein
MAQTSDTVSSVAARLLCISQNDVIKATRSAGELACLVKEIRIIAASALRQDETKS